jgi:hypothetical protein
LDLPKEAMQGLAALPHLEELELGIIDPWQSEPGPELPAMPSLRNLRVYLGGGEHLPISIAQQTRLERLECWNDNFCNADLQHLAGLADLQSLEIDGPRVTDEGIEHLLRLTKLESLSLQKAQVTAGELMKLRALTRLRDLAIPPGNATDAKALQQGLPNCAISVN